MGGMEDLDKYRVLRRNKRAFDQNLLQLVKYSQQLNRQTIFVSLRTPYELQTYAKYCSDVIATYSYNHYMKRDESGLINQEGPAYASLAKVLVGKLVPQGSSPVTINLD